MKQVKLVKRPSFYEKLILAVGLFILVFGYILMQKMLVAQNYLLSWELVQTIFLWLIMVLFIAVLAVAENVREEIKQELRMFKKKR